MFRLDVESTVHLKYNQIKEHFFFTFFFFGLRILKCLLTNSISPFLLAPWPELISPSLSTQEVNFSKDNCTSNSQMHSEDWEKDKVQSEDAVCNWQLIYCAK